MSSIPHAPPGAKGSNEQRRWLALGNASSSHHEGSLPRCTLHARRPSARLMRGRWCTQHCHREPGGQAHGQRLSQVNHVLPTGPGGRGGDCSVAVARVPSGMRAVVVRSPAHHGAERRTMVGARSRLALRRRRLWTLFAYAFITGILFISYFISCLAFTGAPGEVCGRRSLYCH